MIRTYELGIVIEPRQSDDEAQAIVERYTSMIEASSGEITFVDQWGKRKLAYPIRKYNEGRYYFIYVSAEGGFSWTDVERLLMQDEKVLRHLVVRTDEDLKRAKRGKILPVMPWEKAEAKAKAEEAAAAAEALAAKEAADALENEADASDADAEPESDAETKAEADVETKAESDVETDAEAEAEEGEK